MPIVSASRQFTVPEVGYLAWHADWRPPALQVIVAIGIGESQLNNGTYRPESQNPAGGRDIGLTEINDRWQPSPDPFTRFDPLTNLRDAHSIWTGSGFAPWGYPGRILDIAGVTAQIGDDPYNISHSPYWAMVEAGINVWDLPVPPAGVYVSGLPQETLVFGNHGGANPTGPTHGTSINLLQLRLQEIGLYPYSRDQSFYTKTQAGVRQLQTMLMTCRLYSGLIHGNYDRATRLAWDGALRFDYLRRGR